MEVKKPSLETKLGFGAGELEVVREASVLIGVEFPLSDKFSY